MALSGYRTHFRASRTYRRSIPRRETSLSLHPSILSGRSRGYRAPIPTTICSGLYSHRDLAIECPDQLDIYAVRHVWSSGFLGNPSMAFIAENTPKACATALCFHLDRPVRQVYACGKPDHRIGSAVNAETQTFLCRKQRAANLECFLSRC